MTSIVNLMICNIKKGFELYLIKIRMLKILLINVVKSIIHFPSALNKIKQRLSTTDKN